MIFIQQVYEDADIKSEYVRCPSCKRGRLCDKPKGDIATVIALKTDHQEKTGSKIKREWISQKDWNHCMV